MFHNADLSDGQPTALVRDALGVAASVGNADSPNLERSLKIWTVTQLGALNTSVDRVTPREVHNTVVNFLNLNYQGTLFVCPFDVPDLM